MISEYYFFALMSNFLCYFCIIIKPGKALRANLRPPKAFEIGGLHSKNAGVYLIARRGDFAPF